MPADARVLFGAQAADLAAAARAHGGTHSVALAAGCQAIADDGLRGLRTFFERNPGFQAVLETRTFPAALKPARSPSHR